MKNIYSVLSLLLISSLVIAQESETLVPGFNKERNLGPRENHAYVITLQEGSAVVGEAVQHGVDLVIDVFGPDGKLIRTVDSPNGVEGPEPIDVTAFSAGQYKLMIRTLDTTGTVAAGKYVIKIDRVLTAEENGQRMAEKNYPPVLLALWKACQDDSKAVEKFIANRKGKGPIIENLDGDKKNVRVTYLYYGDENTEKVRTSGGPHAGVGGILMQRFLKTPLFFAQELVPKDARFRYNFAAIETRYVGTANSIQISSDVFANDVLNPETFGGFSVLTLPDAPPQTYAEKKESVKRGILTPQTLKSTSLNEDRLLTVYTPPDYDGAKDCNLVIVFDGTTYDGSGSSLVPTPTILDNLIDAAKINSTVAVFVDNMGKRNRDLTDYRPFADFIGTEVVPWVRKNYRIAAGANHVVVAGSSFGGLASSYCAFVHPEAIGNVLSQSGSYWVTKDWQTAGPWPLTDDSGDLIAEFMKSTTLPIKFYLEIGRFDQSGSMVGTNRELRDVLLLKGYRVTYKEFDSGHDYLWWRGSLADGLIALLGR